MAANVADVQDLASWVAAEPDAFLAEAARRRFRWFVRRMFPGYTDGAHLDALSAALDRAAHVSGSRLIVTMPPRHSKSLHVSEHFPAWYLGRWPDRRVIAASHSASLAYTFSRRVRAKFAEPAWPFDGVAVAGDLANVQRWDIEGHRGGYFAVGVGGTPVGSGADLLVIDDPIRSAADAESETIRAALWEWYQGTIRTRLEPGASVVVTATRWHEDDLTGRLLAAQGTGGEAWEHLHFPAVDDAGHPLWPERWPIAELDRTRAAIGARAWESQYQGAPSPAEGAILRREWWQYWRPPAPVFTRILQSWDTAFKAGAGNDYSVGTTWGVAPNGYYLLDRWRDRVEFPALKRAVVAQYERWRPGEVVVEDASSGSSLIQELKHLTRLPIIPYKVDKDKTARVNAVSAMIEAGKVFLPAGEAWLDEFIEECAGFPFAAHDDQVDSVSMALTRMALGEDRTAAVGSYFAPRPEYDGRGLAGRW